MILPLLVPAMAVKKPWAVSCELTCSQSSSLIAQNTIEEKIVTRKNPLPVPAVAVSKPWAISCELTCSQSSSLISQNTIEKIKFNNDITIAGTGSGYEQALDHELRALMLKIKLIDCSKYSLKKKNYTENTTACTGSGCEQPQGHEL
jgi:hypothetical protein